jgi:hypothetical protein
MLSRSAAEGALLGRLRPAREPMAAVDTDLTKLSAGSCAAADLFS